MYTAENALLKCVTECRLDGMTINELKNEIEFAIFPERTTGETKGMDGKSKVDSSKLVANRFRRTASTKNPKNRKSYMCTLRRLQAFVGEEKFEELTFEDINLDWLKDWELFMAKTSPSQNARNVHHRNFRAVINDAIANDVTTNYPYRKFKLARQTTRHRDLTVEEIRQVIFYPCQKTVEKYRDMFVLSFILMGVNFKDLYELTDKVVFRGRLVFDRSKTNYPYSMLIVPEAQALINKYKGKNGQLLYIKSDCNDIDEYVRRTNRALRKVGPYDVVNKHGKTIYYPLFKDITTYWARHSWATIAGTLEIPKETVSCALGHSIGSTITDIYMKPYYAKVDRANRAVLDWVLYGKKEGVEVVKPGTPEFFGLTKSQFEDLGFDKI